MGMGGTIREEPSADLPHAMRPRNGLDGHPASGLDLRVIAWTGRGPGPPTARLPAQVRSSPTRCAPRPTTPTSRTPTAARGPWGWRPASRARAHGSAVRPPRVPATGNCGRHARNRVRMERVAPRTSAHTTGYRTISGGRPSDRPRALLAAPGVHRITRAL